MRGGGGSEKWSESGSTLKIERRSTERLDTGYERKRQCFEQFSELSFIYYAEGSMKGSFFFFFNMGEVGQGWTVI